MRYLSFLALATLVACGDGNPFAAVSTGDNTGTGDGTTDDGTTTDGGTINAALSNDLANVVYNPTAGTLFVDINALDAATDDFPLQEYSRNAALEAVATEMTAQGYEIYSYQDDALDRMFVAIVATSPDGSATGAVVMDGGQFTKFFGGVNYITSDYSPGEPTSDTGLVSYAGTYAGLTNLDADGAQLLPVPGGTDPAIRPDQTAMVEGDIFLNADFGNNSVNGAIYDRSFVNLDPAIQAALTNGADLNDVFLIPTDITTAGTFFGTAENAAQEGIGSYGGAFGGDEAAAVAGGVHLDGDWLPDVDNEEEFGVFVLVQCGRSGDAAICDSIPINP